MGALCSSCFGGEEPAVAVSREGQNIMRGANANSAVITPDPDERRRQLAEAAEKRLQNQEHRGIKNPDSVRRQQQRKEEMERKEEELARLGNTGDTPLKWQM